MDSHVDRKLRGGRVLTPQIIRGVGRGSNPLSHNGFFNDNTTTETQRHREKEENG
jgi:hypothetical protein